MEKHIQRADGGRQLVFGVTIAAGFLVLMYGSVFKGILMGINVLLFIGVCYGSMLAFFDTFRTVLRESVFQTAAVVLLGITFLLYNNLILLTINGFLIIMLVGAQYRFMLRLQKDPLFSVKVVQDACVVWFGYTFAGMPGAFRTLGERRSGGIKGVVVGIIVAVPVLAAILALLASADAAFSEMLRSAFRDIAAEDAVGYSIVGVLLFVCANGLYDSLRKRKPAFVEKRGKVLRLNKIALLLVAGCVDAALAAFAGLQFVYLFSGNVPAGYTYAQYAQSGFWQLVGVAVIVAAIVWIAQRSAAVKEEKSLAAQILLTALCALTEIVLVSAFWRMALYEEAYSFSILRIFTQAFMVATAGVFGVLAAGMWKTGFPLHKWIFIVGMAVYLGLNFMNADAFIAQQNCAIQMENADVEYMAQLSVDALPYWANRIDARLQEKPQEDDYSGDYKYALFCKRLADMREGVQKADGWQYFNVSRRDAQTYMEKYKQAFDEAEKYVESKGEAYFGLF